MWCQVVPLVPLQCKIETYSHCIFRITHRLVSNNVTIIILVPRGCSPFCKYQEWQLLERSNFRSMRRVIVSYSQPIRFVRLDSGNAHGDGKSVNHRLLVLDLSRSHNSWCWPKGGWPLLMRMQISWSGFQTTIILQYKGGKFLKKLWCCVGGSTTR